MQNQPAIHARQTGGFNQGLGNFSDTHLFEQESLDKLQHDVAVAQDTKPELPESPESSTVHPIANQGDTLRELPHQVSQNFIDFLNPLTWFGVPVNKLSPEQKARMAEIHRRIQGFNAEEQQVAMRRMQDLELRKKQQEETELQHKEAERQAQKQFIVPTSKHTGPADAVTQVSQNRQQLSGPASAN